MITSIEWKNNRVLMIDQRLLPKEEKIIEHSTCAEVAASIKNMVIRGAPAIGVAAAMGIALGILEIDNSESAETFEKKFYELKKMVSETRPTAVNLFWALEKMSAVFKKNRQNIAVLKKEMVKEAQKIRSEDIEINRKIGKIGSKLFKDGDTILTHCNTGGLATAGYGTALGVIRSAYSSLKNISVIATETRPYLQGARLTAWELKKENIPFKLITDSMAGSLMRRGRVSAVVVGADRIAGNGDTANKIGTYLISVIAGYNKIPFYVAAPLSTVDLSLETGEEIPIEERSGREVLYCGNTEIAPDGTEVLNPAFDITPSKLITAIITEKKIVKNNFRSELKMLKSQ